MTTGQQFLTTAPIERRASPAAAQGSAARPAAPRATTVSGALALAAVAADLFVCSPCAYAAGLDGDRTAAIVPAIPTTSETRQPQARVQPRAWEFAPPYGKPDLSPENARRVEQLYVEVMRAAPPGCARAAINAQQGGRC